MLSPLFVMSRMSTMIKIYRKKPVQIQALKFEYSAAGVAELKQFCGDALKDYGKNRHMTAIGWAEIGTLEDGSGDSSQAKHIATEGDYIIRGVQGEFYPCKPEIFELTYEEVKND